MIRAWVREYNEWTSGWLVGSCGNGAADKVLVAMDGVHPSSDPGMRLVRTDITNCRPMRTRFEFLPDATLPTAK